MKWKIIIFLVTITLAGVGGWKLITPQISGAPPYEVVDEPTSEEIDRFAWIKNWKRPEGPARVALQAGHYKAAEAPDEQERLRQNTGSSGGGKWEWEVNLKIAELTAEILRARGVEVIILPTTIPPGHWSDVFVSIHADGNLDASVRGFKSAVPRRDMSGKATELKSLVDQAYREATNLPEDANVSRNMRGYYAFGWWRYSHAVHPMTTAMILETGFLTSPKDRQIIVNNPNKSAAGLAEGILNFLEVQELI